MYPTNILILAIVVCLVITAMGVEHFYYSPYANNKCSSCGLKSHFHGDGYDYVNHRFNTANQRGMEIGYGYMHDSRNNAQWTNFPVILYTMKNCPYCKDFEESGTWDKLKGEYGKMANFEIVQREDSPDYITSFPTIVAEVGGDRKTYSGDRAHEDMRQWLNTLMVKK